MKKIIFLASILLSQLAFATPNEDVITYVQKNYEDDLVELLENSSTTDVNLNYQDKDGFSALFWAANKNNPKMMEILLSSSKAMYVLPNLQNKEGDTIFSMSVYNCSECVDLLLKKFGSKIDLNLGSFSPLQIALENKNDNLAATLIRLGANSKNDFVYQDKKGPMLEFLVTRTFPQTLREYLIINKDANMRFANKRTPLMVASFFGQLENVKILLDAGALLNLRDESEYSALMYSVKKVGFSRNDNEVSIDRFDLSVYEYLLGRGAKAEFVTKNGFTAEKIIEIRKKYLLSFDKIIENLLNPEISSPKDPRISFRTNDSYIGFELFTAMGPNNFSVGTYKASDLSSYKCNSSQSVLTLTLKGSGIDIAFKNASDLIATCDSLKVLTTYSNNFYKQLEE